MFYIDGQVGASTLEYKQEHNKFLEGDLSLREKLTLMFIDIGIKIAAIL